ncbi:MAG: hypothetical protein M3539_15980 [Acidobacteriota bacterium]|nr:hypothetical protein [Acidobacteriota bacterium]
MHHKSVASRQSSVVCASIVCHGFLDLALKTIEREKPGSERPSCKVTVRILKIVAGIILLAGAAWSTVRTYKGRGKSSWVILLFALFLVALGLYFLFDAIGGYVRDFRIGSEWIK